MGSIEEVSAAIAKVLKRGRKGSEALEMKALMDGPGH